MRSSKPKPKRRRPGRRCRSGKRRYPDRKSAKEARRFAGSAIKREYACPLCNGWHLTRHETDNPRRRYE